MTALFEANDRPPQAARLAPVLRSWAERGIFFGASSWKYEGWLGQIYSEDRYCTRGRFSRKKFESDCLREYAETFPAVGGDFSFYLFPSAKSWAKLFTGLPEHFQFGLKVPEEITVQCWPMHARYGKKCGERNEHFLDPALFDIAFLRILEPHRRHVGTIMFEFGAFPKGTFVRTADWVARLEPFLAALPSDWPYAVEVRNPEFLMPEYFELLSRYKIAHVFNAWTRMPALAEQIELPGAWTTDFVVVRALLKKGRSYENAVRAFEPYREVKDPDHQTRAAIKKLISQTYCSRRKAYIFVNNRLEGNAPSTIEAVAQSE